MNIEVREDDYLKSIPYFYWEDFIVWLERFTEKHGDFSTDILNNLNNLSCLDVDFISQLSYLYAKIDDYAEDNYLSSLRNNNYECYYFWFRGIGYEIGKEDDDCFKCRRVSHDEFCNYSFIDYNGIIQDKRTKGAMMIDKKLRVLSDMICLLYESDIPLKAIKSTFNSTFSNLESDYLEKEKSKYRCKKIRKE